MMLDWHAVSALVQTVSRALEISAADAVAGFPGAKPSSATFRALVQVETWVLVLRPFKKVRQSALMLEGIRGLDCLEYHKLVQRSLATGTNEPERKLQQLQQK